MKMTGEKGGNKAFFLTKIGNLDPTQMSAFHSQNEIQLGPGKEKTAGPVTSLPCSFLPGEDLILFKIGRLPDDNRSFKTKEERFSHPTCYSSSSLQKRQIHTLYFSFRET